MKIPTIHGYIDRRVLVNFTADPEVVRNVVPLPFRPKVYKDKAIVGICLIRLKHIKPKGWPDLVGVNSENGAHRIAVDWDENGETRSGVYIPRRDTSLKLNALAGGRFFSGKHYFARFDVNEKQGCYNISFKSSDATEISINARETAGFNEQSIFETLENASQFFKEGDLGYSPNGNKFDGLQLKTYKWELSPLEVFSVRSSFFENKDIFPEGSVVFDNALLMTQTEHEWKSTGSKS